MLVLSRKAGDRIIIGDNITIEVVSIVGGKIRIGIIAPETTRIVRGELKDKDETT